MRRSGVRTLLALVGIGLMVTFGNLFPPSHAQSGTGLIELPLMSDYDLDATSYTYCVTNGIDGTPFSPLRATPGGPRVTTSGSSTTVTAVTSGSGPFNNTAVGDEILFNYNGITSWRYVATATSGDAVVVNTAVNFSSPGAGVQWRQRACGTAATSGWFPVRNSTGGTLVYSIDQLDVTGGVDVKFECRFPGSVPTAVTVYSANKTAVTAVPIVWDNSFNYQDCRLGLKIGSADDGADTTTHTEKISAFVMLRR